MRNSGVIQTVINTRERVVSSDINGLQYNQSYALAQVVRRLCNDRYSNTNLTFPGAVPPLPPSGVSGVGVQIDDTGASPLPAEVLGGLLVMPGGAASADLLVQAGTVGCTFPTTPANPLDNPYTLIDDPGVQLAGVIPFVTNPGVLMRGGFVECTPVLIVLTVENRDIFDPVTGLFIPTPVVKSAAGRLSYRWREAATDTSVFPTLDPDWLPLAYTSNRPGSTSFADVTFWDVRPLVPDRSTPFSRDETGGGVASVFRGITYAVDTVGPVTTVVGMYDIDGEGFNSTDGTVAAKNYGRCSGRIFKSIPGTGNLEAWDAEDLDNWATGTVYAPSNFMYIVALFPLGLPRWARYMEAPSSGQRWPQVQRGILTMSQVPALGNGKVLNVPMPRGMDLSAAPGQGGRQIAALYRTPSNTWASMRGSVDGWITLVAVAGIGTIQMSAQAAVNFGGNSFDVDLNGVAVLWFPWMTEILVRQSLTWTPGGGASTTLTLTNYFIDFVTDPTRRAVVNQSPPGFLPAAHAAQDYSNVFRLPMGNSDKARETRYLRAETSLGGAGATVTNYRVDMLGFKMRW